MTAGNDSSKARPTISSIGVTSKGKSVARIIMPSGAIMSIDINVNDFAHLAAAGVQVINGKD